MRATEFVILVSLLSSSASFAEKDHDGETVPGKPGRIENTEREKNRKPAVIENQYIECGSDGKVTNPVPKKLEPNQFIRAMIVRDLKDMWSLASESDVQMEGAAECTTVLTGADSELLGQYSLSFQKQFECAGDPLRPLVPGQLIPGKSKTHKSIRYVGILPERKADNTGRVEETRDTGPIQWVPTPCGLQDEDTVIALNNPEGAAVMRGFSFKSNSWELISAHEADKSAARLLSDQAKEKGPNAEMSRRCVNSLLGRMKQDKKMKAGGNVAPSESASLPKAKKKNSLAMPNAQSNENSSSIQREQEAYFDDFL